jgi:hypothetical protein
VHLGTSDYKDSSRDRDRDGERQKDRDRVYKKCVETVPCRSPEAWLSFFISRCPALLHTGLLLTHDSLSGEQSLANKCT